MPRLPLSSGRYQSRPFSPSPQVTLNLDDKDDQLKVHLPGVGLELMDVVRASIVLPSHMTNEVLQFLTSSA